MLWKAEGRYQFVLTKIDHTTNKSVHCADFTIEKGVFLKKMMRKIENFQTSRF